VTRFVPGPQLAERVAARWAVPEARRLAAQLADRVKANVPGAGVWVTRGDHRVRHTHVSTDGQTIPDNLRYEVEHPSLTGVELARAPGDEELSLPNRINCRCVPVALPELIAEHVATSDVELRGARAHAAVSVPFHRIVESEHPGPGDGGGGWLRRSVEETAAAWARSR
jgi:hypothetical protein